MSDNVYYDDRPSPIGEAYWPFLSKPSKTSGKYEITMKFADADVAELRKELTERLQVYAKAQGVKKLEPILPVFSIDDEPQAGFSRLKAKSGRRVIATDSRGTKIPESILIGNGTKCLINFQPFAYTMQGKAGITFGLNYVIVFDLVEYNPNQPKTLDELGLGHLAGTGSFDASQFVVDGPNEEVPF